MCAAFRGHLCVSVSVCARGTLNTRSCSEAVACKAAREARNPEPITAETACLRPLTGRREGQQSGHLHAFHLDECSMAIANTYTAALLLHGSGDTKR